MNILIIQSNKCMAQLVSTKIENLGHTPIVAESRASALNEFGSHLNSHINSHQGIDFVLIDIDQDVSADLNLIRSIRQKTEGYWLPIVAMVRDDVETEITSLAVIRSGADDCIVKPLKEAFLASKIKALSRLYRENQDTLKRSQTLSRYGNSDDKTDLVNERGFNLAAEKLVKACARNQQSLSVLTIAISTPEELKNKLSLSSKDKAIALMGTTIERIFNRPLDVVSRIDNHYFSVMLPNIDTMDTQVLAEKLNKELAVLPEVTTASIGAYSVNPNLNTQLENLLSEANLALEKAKQAGNNSIVMQNDCTHNSDSNDFFPDTEINMPLLAMGA